MGAQVTDFRVGMKRSVNLGNYETCAFDISLGVKTDDGLDLDTPEGQEALRQAVKTAYDQAARLITEERLRRLKTPDDQVNSTFKVGGTEVKVQR